jgi:acyl-CoA thioesterase-2
MSSFFDLRSTHNPHRWYLPIEHRVTVGHPDNRFMFGGIGLAAGVSALEQTCKRPVIWATAHYLSYARLGQVLDIDVWEPVQGKTVTQARVVGHVDDNEVLTVNAALGVRPGALDDQWPQAPAAPKPEDCPERPHHAFESNSVHDRLEIRVASGRFGADPLIGERDPDGRMMLWIRPREDYPIDAHMLALFGDYLPSCLSNAIGKPVGVTSLDNTIRFGEITPTDWVLCEARISRAHGGFAHGAMHMFSRDGRLMATASQSMILRDMPRAVLDMISKRG